MVSADCQKTWQRPAKVYKWAEISCYICVGRGLLASSHAGTRLPIAALSDSGRSPSTGLFCTEAVCFFVKHSFLMFFGEKEIRDITMDSP